MALGSSRPPAGHTDAGIVVNIHLDIITATLPYYRYIIPDDDTWYILPHGYIWIRTYVRYQVPVPSMYISRGSTAPNVGMPSLFGWDETTFFALDLGSKRFFFLFFHPIRPWPLFYLSLLRSCNSDLGSHSRRLRLQPFLPSSTRVELRLPTLQRRSQALDPCYRCK